MKPRKPANQTLEEQQFFDALNLIESSNEAKDFFYDLCTPAELQAMVDRWQVVHQLHAEKSYRAIQADTGVSVTTVGRVARCLEMGQGGYRAILDKQLKTKE